MIFSKNFLFFFFKCVFFLFCYLSQVKLIFYFWFEFDSHVTDIFLIILNVYFNFSQNVDCWFRIKLLSYSFFVGTFWLGVLIIFGKHFDANFYYLCAQIRKQIFDIYFTLSISRCFLFCLIVSCYLWCLVHFFKFK